MAQAMMDCENEIEIQLFGGGTGNGKDVQQFEKPKTRQSAQPRFL